MTTPLRQVLAAVIACAACGPGVHRDPLGAQSGRLPSTGSAGASGNANRGGNSGGNSGGSIAGAGSPAAAGAGGSGAAGHPALSGSWVPCGRLGSGGPHQMALSADGKTLGVSFSDGSIDVYDVSSRQVLWSLATDAVQTPKDIDVSPDGSRVAAAADGNLDVWRVSDGQSLLHVKNPDPVVMSGPGFSPDGNRILVSRQDGLSESAQVWDLGTGQMSREVPQTSAESFANAGAGVIVSDHSVDPARYFLYGSTAANPTPVVLPFDTDLPMLFSPAGDVAVGYLAAAAGQTTFTLRAVSVPDGRKLWDATLPFVAGDLDFSTDGRIVAAVQESDQARPSVWAIQAFDVQSGSPASVASPLGYQDFRGLVMGPGGLPSLSADASGVWRTGDDEVAAAPFPAPPGQGREIMSLAVSPDGRWLASGVFHRGRSIVVWDLANRTEHRSVFSPPAGSVVFSPDGQQVVQIGAELFAAWPVAGGPLTWTDVRTDLPPVQWGVAYAAAGDWMAFADGGTVRVLRAENSRPGATVVASLPTEQTYPGFAFSPDGQTLATSDPALWRVADGQKLWPSGSTPYPTRVTPDPLVDDWVAFSPDGTSVLVSDGPTSFMSWLLGDDIEGYSRTKIYRASDGTLLRDLGNLDRRPSFSPDGRFVVAGIVVQPVGDGAAIMLDQDRTLTGVSVFTPDGKIAFGGANGIIRLFCPQ
ncbi:MAG TPA: WD40 repeat domain-containing protein [Polyangia bacterium]|nr:WD40 repeat domain-containing protein [Polyangia bacterium]